MTIATSSATSWPTACGPVLVLDQRSGVDLAAEFDACMAELTEVIESRLESA